MKNLALFLLSFYQSAVSPYVGGRCRYVPCCSDYTKDAIRESGVVVGSIKGLARILRCAPWGSSGFDPHLAKSR